MNKKYIEHCIDAFFIGLILGIVCATLLLGELSNYEMSEMCSQAIKRGVAKWAISEDSKTTFTWNTINEASSKNP